MQRRERQKVYEGVAAGKIAKAWLKFAESAIRRGLRPSKLSDTALGDACAQFEDGELMAGFAYSRASVRRIASRPIEEARSQLVGGDFPAVQEYFKGACGV